MMNRRLLGPFRPKWATLGRSVAILTSLGPGTFLGMGFCYWGAHTLSRARFVGGFVEAKWCLPWGLLCRWLCRCSFSVPRGCVGANVIAFWVRLELVVNRFHTWHETNVRKQRKASDRWHIECNTLRFPYLPAFPVWRFPANLASTRAPRS